MTFLFRLSEIYKMKTPELNEASIFKPLIIKEIHEEIQDVNTFVLQETGAEKITYKAGQYLTLVDFDHHEEIRRSYSITSAPVLNEPLTIIVKRIENGAFSRRLLDFAKPGDTLLTSGSGGFFTLPDNIQNYRQVFFLAAGSGIAPIFSLLKSVLFSYPDVSAVLFYSNRSPEQTIFLKPLQHMEVAFAGRLKVEWIFSNVPDLTQAHLYKERLQQFLHRYAAAPYHQILFYICGPESYMRMCTFSLQEEKVPRENIRKENFIAQKALPAKEIPPDRDMHRVTMHFHNEQYRLEVQYPDTILQAAKKQGIILPYSCETGRCGNCVARCLEGNVWLSYNEVLTEQELKQGLTLTCVGYPVQGDVVLEVK